MHDPLVVAFEIKRPWPKRSSSGHRYWPSIVVIWHCEPGGRDAFTICQRKIEKKRNDWYLSTRWKWHFWHWKIQVVPLQHFRRWLLTRCEICGGKSRKGHPVDITSSWDSPDTHWWQGEQGLRHRDCNDPDNPRGVIY